MNSRLIRVFLVLIAIVIGIGASYFLKTVEAKIVGSRAAAESLRDQSSALLDSLADLRSAQVAYVARGQGEGFWMERVSKLLPALDQQTAEFRAALSWCSSSLARMPSPAVTSTARASNPMRKGVLCIEAKNIRKSHYQVARKNKNTIFLTTFDRRLEPLSS